MLGLGAAIVPALWSNSTGPPPFVTGGPFPGERSCDQMGCHAFPNKVNSGRGGVMISVSPYVPGRKQTIVVTVSDPSPTQRRWGFELTARLASNTAAGAGNFSCAFNSNTFNCETADGLAQVICDDGNPPSSGQCAAGKPQFAEHTLAGTRSGASGGVSFQVDWTAPGSDVGAIIFAAAGNAANGNDQADPGDNIYTAVQTVSAASGGPAPTIGDGGVVGAGLSLPRVMQISPNGLISIFGQNLAPPGTAQGAALVNGSLPVNLAGTCVQINNQPAPMLFVSPGQINAQVPSLRGAGNAGVQVITNCGTPTQSASNVQNVILQAAAPEFFFFKQNSDGKNPIAATNALAPFNLIGDPAVLGSNFAPAKPDSYVTLYATGLGATSPPVPAGSLAGGIATTVNKTTVSLNGAGLSDSDVLYAGAAPGFAGLYQINIHIPAATPDGNIPVAASVAGFSTPPGAFITVKK
jgi:uncharacterized protein (TIGR03437 family)